MKSIQADYTEDRIRIREKAEVEDWVAVCRRFDDDVERVCDVSDMKGYTGLYVCCDEASRKFYYLVEEDKALYRLKRKHFLDNIGMK